ncbi:Panacea domain-containing protein [Brevibacillus laterosporus]|uniref:Panacea domain-containing protein n=1 Tax=Brevibacillus laterosporus TaxID=1465 RepID=UPI0035A6B5CB
MAFHFVAITSNYAEGSRVGWHYASEDRIDKTIIKDFMEKIERTSHNTQLGIHKLSTNSIDWRSVVEKDSFFNDVIITKDIDKFIAFISQDRELGASDITKFILSIVSVSHLKLQKILYYAYATYLLSTGEKLFKEPIVAYKYGPVVEEIYQKYKGYGSFEIDQKEDRTFVIYRDEFTFTPSYMRIISSRHGITAAKVIVDVLEKYLPYSPSELVDKTHAHGGPWSQVYEAGFNCVVDDDTIRKYHYLTE